MILIQHPLQLISYCAEDRRYDNIFAYIIKPKKKDQPIVCYAYETLDTEVHIAQYNTLVAYLAIIFDFAMIFDCSGIGDCSHSGAGVPTSLR